MSEKTTMTNFNREVITIPPREVGTLDFMGIYPNYFRVQNTGSMSVYCSPNNIPTVSRYDFSVSAGGLSMYGEPTPKSKLHIYNPNGTAVTCTVITFKGEFDPLILALSNIEVDMPSSIETSNVIGGFTTSLPAGSNNIGSVGVTNFPTDYAKAANQKDYTTILTNLFNVVNADPDYTAKLEEILAAVKAGGSGGGGGGGGSVSPEVVTAFGGGSEDVVLTAPEGCKISEIVFFSNDSENDMTLSHTDYNGVVSSVVLKAGEVLNNIPTWADSVSIVCNGGAFRYGWTVKTA